MRIIIGGVCCHDWTEEPKYPVAPPKEGDLSCECDPPCEVSYINIDSEKLSYDWRACTF